MKINEILTEAQTETTGYEKGKVKHDKEGFELYHPNTKVQLLVKNIAKEIGRKYKGMRNMGDTSSPPKFKKRAGGMMTSWSAKKEAIADIKKIIQKYIQKSGLEVKTRDSKNGPFEEIQIIVPHELSHGEQMKLV